MYLVNTKSNKAFLKGKKSDLIAHINKWAEFELGKKMPKSYNVRQINIILAERCGEWTSPRGVEGVYKIITEKELIKYA